MAQDRDKIEDFIVILVDRLTASELVELLEITTEELIEAFEEKVLDNTDELWEFLKYGR